MKTNPDTPAFTLTVEELSEQVKKIMSECLDGTTINPTYLSREKMADKLGVSLPTLDKATDEGVIPYVRLGKLKIFVERDVYKALKSTCPTR